jgi:hypothetical protein
MRGLGPVRPATGLKTPRRAELARGHGVDVVAGGTTLRCPDSRRVRRCTSARSNRGNGRNDVALDNERGRTRAMGRG